MLYIFHYYNKFYMVIYKLAACVYDDYIYTSSNFGDSWTKQTSLGQNGWSGITSSSDGTKLAACADNNYVYTSTDSGVTWIQQNSSGYWSGITSSSDGTKLAAYVYGGYIYTSTDSGATWTKQTGSGVNNWLGITSSSDGTKLAACGIYGYIYTSTDSGATWTEQTSLGSRLWTGITSSLDGTKLAACVNDGYIYTSTDSGNNWTEQTGLGVNNWYKITSSSDGIKLAVCTSFGYIYTSSNSGATWTQQIDSGENYWIGITSSSDGTKLAACVGNSYIYTSTDSGASWTQTNSEQLNWTGITLSEFGGVCFKDDTKILMSDNTYKYIKDIKRGDSVKTDKNTNKSNKVARLIDVYLIGKFVKIPKGLIDNTDEIITTEFHPFWVNNDNNRVLAKDIKGIELIDGSYKFYNLQFEDDETFYAEDVKVDSLSPNHKKYKLPKILFWDETKYDKNLKIKSETDPKYKKPKLIRNYIHQK